MTYPYWFPQEKNSSLEYASLSIYNLSKAYETLVSFEYKIMKAYAKDPAKRSKDRATIGVRSRNGCMRKFELRILIP